MRPNLCRTNKIIYDNFLKRIVFALNTTRSGITDYLWKPQKKKKSPIKSKGKGDPTHTPPYIYIYIVPLNPDFENCILFHLNVHRKPKTVILLNRARVFGGMTDRVALSNTIRHVFKYDGGRLIWRSRGFFEKITKNIFVNWEIFHSCNRR